MSANEREYLPPDEAAENLIELANTMEADVENLRSLSKKLQNGEITVAQADRNGEFDLETDEYL